MQYNKSQHFQSYCGDQYSCLMNDYHERSQGIEQNKIHKIGRFTNIIFSSSSKIEQLVSESASQPASHTKMHLGAP